MLIRSPVIAEGSGSLAGITISRNRGGMYLRQRVVPVNPSTPAQIGVRTELATLAARWSDTLTQVQRDTWDLYALNVPMPGPLGNLRNVGGLGMFIRTGIPRDLSAENPLDVAPGIFDLGTFTPVGTAAADAAADDFTFDYENTDEWANEDAAYMLVFLSRPQNPGVNYFTGPYRFSGSIAGDSGTPPSGSAVIASPFPFVVDQKMFCRVQVIRSDGRYSTSQRLEAIAT